MCTSIVVNKKKTIVGWNLDILDMEYRVRPAEEGVCIPVFSVISMAVPEIAGFPKAVQNSP